MIDALRVAALPALAMALVDGGWCAADASRPRDRAAGALGSGSMCPHLPPKTASSALRKNSGGTCIFFWPAFLALDGAHRRRFLAGMAATQVEADHACTEGTKHIPEPRTVSGKQPSTASLQRSREYMDWLAALADPEGDEQLDDSWTTFMAQRRARMEQARLQKRSEQRREQRQQQRQQRGPQRSLPTAQEYCMLNEQSVSERGCSR